MFHFVFLSFFMFSELMPDELACHSWNTRTQAIEKLSKSAVAQATFPKEVLGNPARFILKPAEVARSPLQSQVIRKVLEAGFSEAIQDGDFDCLIDQWIEVRLTDVDLSWCLSLNEHRKLLIERTRPSVTQITGDAVAFALIAGGKVDPDTLFFQRRILITGDTELGHEVKTCFDGLTKSALPPVLQKCWKVPLMPQTLGERVKGIG